MPDQTYRIAVFQFKTNIIQRRDRDHITAFLRQLPSRTYTYQLISQGHASSGINWISQRYTIENKMRHAYIQREILLFFEDNSANVAIHPTTNMTLDTR